MKEKLEWLIQLALERQATDLHFTLQKGRLDVKIRGRNGMEDVHSALLDVRLFHYLKYIADLDLGNSDKPQSGSFHMKVKEQQLYFRFSLISSYRMQTGVLRILNNHPKMTLQELTQDMTQLEQFMAWTRLHSGMVILSGPTGSGKTTTLHAILDEIANRGQEKIMTLEDPVEIHDDRFVQLAVNESCGFTYEEGIRQLMRHDPDVIMIGEIRDPYTARMAFRCALTGHMVFSCVHARSATEALKRLDELGIHREELQDTLSAVCAQRLYPRKGKEKERICIYEILEGNNLREALMEQKPKHHVELGTKIRQAVESGLIEKEAAQREIIMEAL